MFCKRIGLVVLLFSVSLGVLASGACRTKSEEKEVIVPEAPSEPQLTPAAEAFNQAAAFLLANPDQLQAAEEMFLSISTEFPETPEARQAGLRAVEIGTLRCEQTFTRLQNLDGEVRTGNADINDLISFYLDFMDTFTDRPEAARASDGLNRLLQDLVRVNLVCTQVSGLAFAIEAQVVSLVDPAAISVTWTVNGRQFQGSRRIVQSIVDGKLRNISAAVMIAGRTAVTARTVIDPMADGFSRWRTWALAAAGSADSEGEKYWLVQLADGREFTAVATDSGYQARLEFGTADFSREEVVQAEPFELPSLQFKAAISEGLQPGDRGQLQDLKARFSDSRSIIEIITWWQLYLDPQAFELQEELNLVSLCADCSGRGFGLADDIPACTTCGGDGRAMCRKCQGTGKEDCRAKGCRRGRIANKLPPGIENDLGYHNNPIIIKSRKCPACDPRGKTTCSLCNGRGTLLCSNCRGLGVSGTFPLCMSCEGRRKTIRPVESIAFPFKPELTCEP